jgi:endonuclease YncB( thermonuclease family)
MYRLLAIAFLLLAFSLTPCQAKEQEALVTKVIDGDTIQLESGDIVHYIGISAPHLKNKEGGNEFFAPRALEKCPSRV